jgi:hypothetical protein
MTTGTSEVSPSQDLAVVETVPPRLSVGNIGRLKTRTPRRGGGRMNALIYGWPGAGKSLLSGMAAMVPEMCPVLYVDIDKGSRVLEHLGDEAIDRITVVPDPDSDVTITWDDMQTIYDYLFKGRHPFETVIVDSVTEAQAVNMGHLAGYDEQVELNAPVPKFDEWNETTAQMRRFFRGFRDLPINSIFIAQTTEVADPKSAAKKGEDPKMLLRPSLSKKLRNDAPAHFDAVLYMYSMRRGRQNVRFVQTDGDDFVVAKCRFPGVPVTIENPTMELLYDMMVRNPRPSTVNFTGGGGVGTAVTTGEQSQRPMMRKRA